MGDTVHHNTIPSLNAWLLHIADGLMHRIYGTRKRSIYRKLPGTVVEIGPGAGANFRYYKRGTRVIAVEPNVSMHPRLRKKARRRGLDLVIKSVRGEQIDLPDRSVSAVVGTLVLCTVDDPGKVVSEIYRILKPSGRYLFLEHVGRNASHAAAQPAREAATCLASHGRWVPVEPREPSGHCHGRFCRSQYGLLYAAFPMASVCAAHLRRGRQIGGRMTAMRFCLSWSATAALALFLLLYSCAVPQKMWPQKGYGCIRNRRSGECTHCPPGCAEQRI